MKRVTLKKIAEITGVSVSTVSRALSGSTEIGETTRKRIIEVCEQEGYVPNQVARSLVSQNTKTIGLIVTDISNPYMSEMARYLEKLAWEKGYVLNLLNSYHNGVNENEIMRHMLERRVDGVIISPINQDTHREIRKYTKQIPTVFLGQQTEGSRETHVSIDNYQGGYKGAKYLYNMGHRRIAYLGKRTGSATHEQRSLGYLALCEKYGLYATVIENESSASTIDKGYQLALELLERPEQYTAIFASADSIALGALKAAAEKGLSVPEDISVLGFDNILFADLPNIDLTTIDGMKEQIAKTAMDTLVDYIEKETPGYTYHVIPPGLVERKSVKKLVQD